MSTNSMEDADEPNTLKTSWEDLTSDPLYQQQIICEGKKLAAEEATHEESLGETARETPPKPATIETSTATGENKSTSKTESMATSIRQPLSGKECSQLFDDDGRLVREARLRKALFEGGIDPSWQKYVWKFLFGIYPFNSTYREQKTIDLENRARYNALHERWVILDKTVHLPDEEPSTDPLEYVFSSEGEELEFDEAEVSSSFQDNAKRSKVYSFAERVSLIDQLHSTSTSTNNGDHEFSSSEFREYIPSSDFMSPESCPYCCHSRSRSHSSSQVLTDDESRSLLAILELPSKVYATRQPVDLSKSYPKGKRLILRDVKRTDRVVHYFSHKRNLRKVHRILHIFALFHPELGYAQGMNDILARFLVVTDSEVDSYWMFCNYMEKKRADFLEDTMMCKITLVRSLMAEISEELHDFFEVSECSDYLFCHRWLLLDFKREFVFMDSLRILEVLMSNHLELSSDRAAIEQERVVVKEFEAEGGESRAVHVGMNTSFTYDLFICIAILTLHQHEVTKENDAASVYGYLNSLCMKMDVNEVLAEAERLILNYCRQSVLRGFKAVNI